MDWSEKQFPSLWQLGGPSTFSPWVLPRSEPRSETGLGLGRKTWLRWTCPPLRSGCGKRKRVGHTTWRGEPLSNSPALGRPTQRYFHVLEAKLYICKHNVFPFSCWGWNCYCSALFLLAQMQAERLPWAESCLPMSRRPSLGSWAWLLGWEEPQAPNPGWGVISFEFRGSSRVFSVQGTLHGNFRADSPGEATLLRAPQSLKLLGQEETKMPRQSRCRRKMWSGPQCCSCLVQEPNPKLTSSQDLQHLPCVPGTEQSSSLGGPPWCMVQYKCSPLTLTPSSKRPLPTYMEGTICPFVTSPDPTEPPDHWLLQKRPLKATSSSLKKNKNLFDGTGLSCSTGDLFLVAAHGI